MRRCKQERVFARWPQASALGTRCALDPGRKGLGVGTERVARSAMPVHGTCN